MLIHTVFFWLKPEVNEEKIQIFREEIEKLIRIDLIEKAYLGQPAKTEGRPAVDQSFHTSTTLLFKNIENQNAYQAHPVHHAFVERTSSIRDHEIVYDSEIILEQ